MEHYFRVWNHMNFRHMDEILLLVCQYVFDLKAISHIAFLELHKNKFCCCPCEILGWLEKVDLHCLKVWRSWIWQYRLLSFQAGYTKLKIFLTKNQHNQRKLLNFENWTNGEPQNMQKSEFLKLVILIFQVKKLNN